MLSTVCFLCNRTINISFYYLFTVEICHDIYFCSLVQLRKYFNNKYFRIFKVCIVPVEYRGCDLELMIQLSASILAVYRVFQPCPFCCWFHTEHFKVYHIYSIKHLPLSCKQDSHWKRHMQFCMWFHDTEHGIMFVSCVHVHRTCSMN